MLLKDRDARRFKLRPWMLPVGLLLLFLVAFAKEIFTLILVAWNIARVVVGFEPMGLPTDLAYSIQVLVFNCLIGFLGVFLVWLLMVSTQALLPISTVLEFEAGEFRVFDRFQEIYRAAFHLLLHMFGMHGPAVFIRDGVEVSTPEELSRPGFGVAVVDYNSAVVLEEQIPPPGTIRRVSNNWMNILVTLGLCDPFQSPRACGPGIVFTRPLERIWAVVDLHKQFRIRTNISCYTRDGIELSSNVWAIFTIGQESDTVQVGYIGERRAENLRVLTLERVSDTSRMRVTGLSDDLDEADRREIYHFARVAERLEEVTGYSFLPMQNNWPVFNPQRVFAAVFAQARNNKNELIPWTDLPTSVAAEIFREVVSQINYEDFYKGDDPNRFPLPAIKSRLRLAMRNNSILSFRVLYLRDRQPFTKNVEYELSELRATSVRPLTSSKMLRDRGIKVIASGFGDLLATSPAILEQRIDNWSAPWMREAASIQAERDLEVMRIRSRAQAQAQQALFNSLSHILEDRNLSEEALAIRIYQSLEVVAADPLTRQFLPSNTIDMMRTIHTWLLPEDQRQGPRP